MELARPEALVQEQAEVPEWVDLAGEGWAAPEPVLARVENASVLNAGLLSLMKSGFPAHIKPVQNVVQRW
jgi:hypothetical protein